MTNTGLHTYRNELQTRCDQIHAFLKSDAAKLIHEDDRHLKSLEYSATSELLFIVNRQIERGETKESNIEFGDPSEFWRDEFMV